MIAVAIAEDKLIVIDHHLSEFIRFITDFQVFLVNVRSSTYLEIISKVKLQNYCRVCNRSFR